MTRVRMLLPFAVSLAAASGLSLSPVAAGSAPASPQTGEATDTDFNGDGFADLVAAQPGAPVGGHTYAGTVTVLYGSPRGVTTEGGQLWTQDSEGLEGEAGKSHLFGVGVGVGDFDADGFDDLAAGTSESPTALHVIRGSPSGLSADGDYRLSLVGPLGYSRLGMVMVVTDFDQDGYDDLATSGSWGTVGRKERAGNVGVVFGGPGGLDLARTVLVTLEDLGIETTKHDYFGAALSAGDIDGDGYAELAVGIPDYERERRATEYNDGAVAVLPGSADGPVAAGARFYRKDTPGIAGDPEQYEQFGTSVSVSDLDADGYAEVVIGSPGDDLGDKWDCGSIVILPGGPDGEQAAGSERWTLDRAGVEGSCADRDGYGRSLASADFDDDGYAELVVGVPFRGMTGLSAPGAVSTLPGSADGVSAKGDRYWTQDSTGIADEPETFDRFGYALSVADYDGDGFTDAIFASPTEEVDGVDQAGLLHVLYGSTKGLRGPGSQLWHAGLPDMPDDLVRYGTFGGTLIGR